jgi:prepilin-type N-terminal cleavage/methylation domain-containing protein
MSSINNHRGFTLLEMLIVMVLALGILGTIIAAYSVTLSSFSGSLGRATLFDNASGTLDKMAKDIRMSRQVISAQPSKIALWYVDLNGNYQVDANEIVTYEVQAGKLVKSTSTESGPVTDLVMTLALSYDAVANPNLVTVDLTLAKNNQVLTLEGKTKLRNVTE